MISQEAKKLKLIYVLLISSLALMVVTQIGAALSDGAHYLIGLLISFVIAGIRWFYLKKHDAATFKKVLVLLILLIAVFGPILFILIKWLVMGGSFFSFQFVMILCFILPIALILYCIYLVQQMLQANVSS
jgi:hypothetical protein